MFRLRLREAAPVAVACLLMLAAGLLLVDSGEGMIRRCTDGYAHARTAADTTAMDNQHVGGGRVRDGGTTCGRLRREGFLDSIRRAAPGASGAADGGTQRPSAAAVTGE